jgi:4-amino-4-deoxy-L-arabinose transferase-like glycosyltransferase
MRRDVRVIVGLIALSAILRLPNLGKESLWFDEAHTWMTTSQTLTKQWNWQEPLDIGNPPLFFSLVTFSRTLFGDGEVPLRAVSAISSIATTPVVFFIALALGNSALAACAALLFALSPFSVHYAQEARAYGFMNFAISLAMLAAVRVVRVASASAEFVTPQSSPWRDWIVLGVASAAALLSHNTAVFPVAGLYVVVVWAWIFHVEPSVRRRFAAGAATSAAIALGLWSLWWPGLWQQVTRLHEDLWIPRPTFRNIAAAFSPIYAGHLVREELAPATWEIGALAAVSVLIAVVAARAFWRWRRDAVPLAFMTVLTIAVPALMVATSFWMATLLPRTAVWLTIPASIVLASGVLSVRPRAARNLLLTAMVGLDLYGLWNYHVHFHKEAWRSAAALVARDYRQGDVIVFCAGYLSIPFDYYFRDSGFRPRRYHIESAADQSALDEVVQIVAERRSRVWLVYAHEWLADPKRVVPGALAAAGDRLSQSDLYAVRVELYGPPQTGPPIK